MSSLPVWISARGLTARASHTETPRRLNAAAKIKSSRVHQPQRPVAVGSNKPNIVSLGGNGLDDLASRGEQGHENERGHSEQNIDKAAHEHASRPWHRRPFDR